MIPAFFNVLIDAEEEERRQDLARERRNLRLESNPFELPDDEFRKIHRLSKELAQNLITELEPHMNAGQRITKLLIQLRVLDTLRFFARGSYQKRVEEMRRKKDGFNINNFPGAVGCVDGTHITIKGPNEDGHLYFNRKGYFSKNVQIICDTDLKVIVSINANFGGATHDTFIWRNSAAANFLEERYRNGDHNTWLLGDSGYPQQPWLMTPIKNAPPNTPEDRFNQALTIARCTIERCIGVLKQPFRCINKKRVLRYAPYKAGQIINSCAVLHNICIMGNMPLEDEIDDNDIDNEQNHHAPNEELNFLAEGQQRRLELVNTYFQ